jgi:hypothetical protein
MGPDELDDLLNNNGAGPGKGSALALYEGTREEDLVDEEIDERVLGLLGLEDVFDIDYGTYITLLKERLAASRNFEKKLSSEEDELLVSEFRRVKGKVGRFKLKKRKVTSEDIGVTGPIKVSSSKFLLAGKAVIPEREATESSSDIADIQKSLDAILKTLTLQNKDKKKASEDERKKSEDRRRRAREGDLEKPLSQLKSLAQKIIAPAQGILDRIFRFIKFTLLGYAFNQLVKWFSDPKNAEKVKVLGRFLKDWWPALLSAYVLFATPFGKFIRVTLKLLRGFIPRIARFIAANPKVFATVALVGGSVVAGTYLESRSRGVDENLLQRRIQESKDQGKPLSKEDIEKTRLENLQKRVEDIRGTNIPGSALAGGGIVPRLRAFTGGAQVKKEVDVKDIQPQSNLITEDTGLKVKGAGPDTQLVAAMPGEVLISKEAVDTYGAKFFLDLNKKGGGTNIPRMVNNIQLAAGGGLIKKPIKAYQGGGMIGGGNLLKGIYPGYSRSVGGTMASSGGMGGSSNPASMSPMKISSLGGMSGSSGGMMRGSGGMSGSIGGMMRGSIGGAMSGAGASSGGGMSINNYRQSQNTSNNFFMGSSGAGNSSSLTNIMNTIKNTSNYKLPSISSNTQEFGSDRNKLYSPQTVATLSSKNVLNQSVIGSKTLPNIQPINISPPPTLPVAPGPPVIYTKTTYTILPPIKAPSKAPPSVPRGSKLPEFSASSSGDSRSKIATALGITDLVGVV